MAPRRGAQRRRGGRWLLRTGEDGRVYNSAVAFPATPGSEPVFYRKLHLWDREKLVFTPGSVELAKKFGSEDSGRFVNGLLDRIAKSPRLG